MRSHIVVVNDVKKGDISMGNHRCRPRCGCQRPVREIVHPVKENVVHCCTEETVCHVHPSHTTVVNHHLIRNEHVYPHTTSHRNTVNEVDVQGTSTGPGSGQGGFQQGGNQVGGAMNHGKKNHGCNCHSCKRRRRRF